MAVADPYRVLQVLSTADQEVLSAAYRALAQKYHPDHDASRLAARRMAELNAAWAIVCDPDLRANWDRSKRRVMYDFKPEPVSATVRPPPRSTRAGTKLAFGRYAGWALQVLEISEGRFSYFNSFLDTEALFPLFGLPQRLDAEGQPIPD